MRKALGTIVPALIPAMLVLCRFEAAASPLKADEEIIFFTTAARLDADGVSWTIPVHGWIFEPEDDSAWRQAVIGEILEHLELDGASAREEIFRRRARMFLVDNERGKEIRVRSGAAEAVCGPSGADGHFTGAMTLARTGTAGGGRLMFEAVVPAGDGRRFEGTALLLAPEGISVISDIDDTIKVSRVTDKRELLANTFLREFAAVPGMADLYRGWGRQGAAFHYVSASPWQLYPALSGFLAEQGFPEGVFHLKPFRVKDETFFALFASPETYKVPVIEGILNEYPQRPFILVGDNTERDPEVYGEIARRHPGQVRRVFIREAAPEKGFRERLFRAFAGSPAGLWTIFSRPEEPAGYRLPGADGTHKSQEPAP